ncbi:MAG: 23S rRNA pseudouridine(955/2504/2580) synthase RluC [Gammaproteobacteria bacterium]|jgi:23S rRNA pseudouridine955/2504/2580 synthase|nr:23S rRNA pseudouridine(955/2504/2580) synthase RluC [Gammaproteobacteria bacterium]
MSAAKTLLKKSGPRAKHTSSSPVSEPTSPVLAKVRLETISADRAGQRLDNYLIGQLKGAPKSLIYRIVRKGEVRVNKGRTKPEYKLCAGDVVRIPPVKLPEPNAPVPVGDSLKKLLQSAILYESDGLMIVNKPSGLAVHGGSGVNLGLIESLRQVFPQYRFLELVHRLDRDTSGCIMVAKKRSCLRAIHEQLRNTGGIDKVYHALVAGGWPRACQQVKAPLLRFALPSGERMVRVDGDGKRSITRYRILQEFGHLTLVEAKPVTGRTHQIRVHCQYMGHPIVGDEKYGQPEVNQSQQQRGLKRLFLHAAELRLTDPSTTKSIIVKAPYDQNLTTVLHNLATG